MAAHRRPREEDSLEEILDLTVVIMEGTTEEGTTEEGITEDMADLSGEDTTEEADLNGEGDTMGEAEDNGEECTTEDLMEDLMEDTTEGTAVHPVTVLDFDGTAEDEREKGEG
ncbi:hypothetical protein V5O48_016004 [Marasmius crinis-equi]|uniref:Uncharacterized protein n=1 Tax=Marasmius crinis-equi TaxID=585013 RepID=A0ABR3ESY6_9AGAR